MIPEVPGRNLLVADLVGTGLLLLGTVAGATGVGAGQVFSLIVSGLLFVGGCVAFFIGFVRAADRSRTEALDLAGLFYLTNSAPREVRRWFLGLWFAQMGIAVLAIAITRPPFAVMAPVWGIGLITWWASRHASFPPREAPAPK